MQELPNSAEVHLGKAIAALNDETFETLFYHWLSRSIEVDNTTMLAYFQQHRPRILFAHAYERRVHARLDSDYVSGAYLLDPFHALHVEKAPEDLYQLRDIAPDQFQRNEYFAAYYQQTTLIDEIAFVGYPADGVSVHICLGRDAVSGRRFSARDIATARRLAPIACGLIRQRWSDLRSSGDYSEQALAERLIESLLTTHGIKLSPRQAEIALLILRGHSSVSIGLRLEISSQTVKVFRKQLYRKCSISSQAELFSLIMPILSESVLHKPR
ncbi:helix-turn-helix transcriptional regulator [Thalassospira alkalitolerans]|uniref:LuxR family transcriptional regulator n=1 Tax=Thalassospira alkalitolerans TaxID=1293890 RepID=A0A1Y2L704_9PROT|nr:helix-turn-helix transcriptional regulator [Thalassospira alkalitolerans]OSQ44610.1 LuxR family transcriptional regulator [Thalassospira alkalitolerans]